MDEFFATVPLCFSRTGAEMNRPILDYETPRREPTILPPLSSLPMIPLVTRAPSTLPSLSSLPPVPLITQAPPLPRVNRKLRNWCVLALTLAAVGAVLFLTGNGRALGLALLLIALPIAALTTGAGLLALPGARSRSGIIGSVLLAAAVLLLVILVLKADPMFGDMLKYGGH
jgi:hypothetical protein